ncbi:MAG: glycosyltransferase [Pseudosphingobacterium sp.]|nr:glycosyltransferase [Olivibacter sp. UJ_SKK_5.1]MDX3912686.1 glycosyltransferase [Pseudosphingobacterium sp.]
MNNKEIFLYDLMATQPNDSGKFHGGGKYAKKVFLELCSQNRIWELKALYNKKKPLEKDIVEACEKFHVQLIDTKGENLVSIINEEKVSRFYSALPEYVVDALKGGCDFYGTVHGLRMLETRLSLESLKYADSLKGKLKYLVKIAFDKHFVRKDKERLKKYVVSDMKLIAVSNHTQFSLANYFKEINPSQIKVFYSPSVADYNYDSDVHLPSNLKKNGFFLLVSGNRWIKNNLRAIRALDELFDERPHDITQLVVVTGVSNSKIFRKQIKNQGRFLFLEYVDEHLLNSLYKESFAMLYPSLNEGFGYPPLEAMRYGKPVIASPITSISEICGDAVLYANPYDIKEVKNRVMQLSLDKNIYESLTEKGKDRYAFIYRRQKEDLQALVDYLLN